MKKSVAFLVVFLLLSLIGIFGFYTVATQPADKNDTTEKIFLVNQGESVRSIGERLEKEGFIKNSLVFLFEVKRLGIGERIQAGDFRLSKSKTPLEIATLLTTGTLDVWVRILEGWRAEEIAAALKDTIPTYDNTWLPLLKKQEGYLFPDTYLIPKNADSTLVLAILSRNFDTKTQPLLANIGKNGLTWEQTIILASLVEREARSYEVKQQVASILLRRFTIGMKLDVDATVQYALGFQPQEKSWWKKALTTDDLAINSVYNTYTHAGLPPTPISNPGLTAIEATLNANPSTPYLYYLHDANGNTYYSKTLEEHNQNAQKHL